MKFFSKPPQGDVLRERVKDVLGITKTRIIIFSGIIIIFVLARLILSFPISNLVFLFLGGYHLTTSILFLYLFSKWKDNSKVIIVLDIFQTLLLVEIVLNLFVIYYISPVFIHLFGSSLWLAFFFYLFYTGAEIGPSYNRRYANFSFVLSSFCCAIIVFWEYSGTIPPYEFSAFLPGFFYQKPISSLILFLSLMVIFIGIRGFNSEVWKKFREINQQLKKITGELEIRVKERTEELEKAKTILEIKVVARTKELRELTESLDNQVKEKTKELEERIDELEKFHKLTVDRELRMIELKKELNKLEKELELKKGQS